jgi:ribose transport system ATP-binding protein
VLVEHMVGRKVEQLFPERRTGTGEVVLDVRGMTRSPVVRDVSFQVHAGEVVGIGGLVGAGRTELLRLVYGLDRRDAGEVVVSGAKLPPGRPAAAIAAGLGLAPEDRKSQGLLLDWSTTKNVTLADLGRFASGGLLSPRAERDAAEGQLRELNTVPGDGNRITRELSGGNQQKVVLARWLLRHCKVLLLDEPTRGVDVGAKAEIYRVIDKLADAGLGVLVVSSELSELAGLCTRVLVMREGRIVAEVPGEEATELELLRHAVIHEDTAPVAEEAV